jgi:hypothetical protein
MAGRVDAFNDVGIVLCCDDLVKRSAVPVFCFTRLPRQDISNRRMDEMSAVKMLGIVLIVAGGLGLLYGGFTYTQDTHEAKLGPLELSIKDKKTVNIPIWAGVGAIVAGGILLLVRSK